MYSIDEYPWDMNPLRKWHESILAKHEGLAKKVKTYPYGNFSKGARQFIESETQALPECPVKKLSFEIIPIVQAPTQLKIRMAKLSRGYEKSMHEEIMTNSYISPIIHSLALNKKTPREIYTIISNLEGEYPYSFDQIDKYLYFFWNTQSTHEWNVHRHQELGDFFDSDPMLSKQFATELTNGFGGLSQLAVYINLNIATEAQQNEFFISKLRQKILAALDLVEDDMFSTSRHVRSESDIKAEYRRREFLRANVRELSLALSRAMKSKNDTLKAQSSDSEQQPRFKIYGNKTAGQKTYSLG